MAAETIQPLRYSVRTAARLLGMGPDAVRVLAKAGTLTPLYPAGRGRGKKVYLLPDEVHAYATGGLEGVVAYRKRKRKGKPS